MLEERRDSYGNQSNDKLHIQIVQRDMLHHSEVPATRHRFSFF
jgi:hypothetical protein